MPNVFTLGNVPLCCSRVESSLTIGTWDIVWIFTWWWWWKVSEFATFLQMFLHLPCSSNCLDKVLYNKIPESISKSFATSIR
jgi:hypothetical protein